MNNYIDNYCERTAPGFWNEPLNAVTNGAFLVAALLAFLLARQKGTFDKETVLLIVILTAIGIGSFLFHTFATGWAMLADTLPILFFQIAFLTIYALRVMNLGWGGALLLLVLFIFHVMMFAQFPENWLNGSLGYAPAFQFLLILGAYHWYTQKPDRWGLLLASAVFALSLALRTFDMDVCESLPVGVHFLWHCLNAVVLYLCIRCIIWNKAAKEN